MFLTTCWGYPPFQSKCHHLLIVYTLFFLSLFPLRSLLSFGAQFCCLLLCWLLFPHTVCWSNVHLLHCTSFSFVCLVLCISLRLSSIHSLTHSSWHVCVDVASRTIRLNSSLFWALICSHFFMSSVHLLFGRPFVFCLQALPPICAFLGSRVFLGGRSMIVSLLWCCSTTSPGPLLALLGFLCFFSFCYPWYSEYPPIEFCFKGVDFLFICCCQGPSFAPIYGCWKYACSNDFQLCLFILSFPDFFPFSYAVLRPWLSSFWFHLNIFHFLQFCLQGIQSFLSTQLSLHQLLCLMFSCIYQYRQFLFH